MLKPEILVFDGVPDDLVARAGELFEIYRLGNLQGVEDRITGILCTSAATVDADLISRFTKLQIISNISAGQNKINLGAARDRGITVTNTSAQLCDDVADTAIGLMLMVRRRFAEAERFARQGRWANKPFPHARQTAGRTIGIFGLGSIGSAIADRAVAMKMSVLYCGRTPKDVPFRFIPTILELARLSDVLVLSSPLSPETQGVVDRTVLQHLGPNGTLINVSRGAVVDQVALIEALQSGTIAGAGLDVFDGEPIIPPLLRELDNVVMLPHIGSATVETLQRMKDTALDNLTLGLLGRRLMLSEHQAVY